MNDCGNHPLPATFRHAIGLVKAAAGGQGGTKLLDVGCGDGRLLAAIGTSLPNLDLHGLDVTDHGLQTPGFLSRASETLSTALPGRDWGARIHAITTGQAWPMDDSSIDILVTNQVLEHVADLGFLFQEQARVLKPGGIAFHIFPAREVIVEPHYFVPLAHRLPEGRWRRGWLTFWAMLGIGDYGGQGAAGLRAHAALADQSLTQQVAYRDYAVIGGMAQAAGFGIDWRQSAGLYGAKAPWLGRIASLLPLFILARLSSLTLICRKI